METLFNMEDTWDEIWDQIGICRDCGQSGAYFAGGAKPGFGLFSVCAPCTQLDGCTTRKHEKGENWHVSFWGESHPASEHNNLIEKQRKRRNNYLKKAGKL